MCAMPLSSVRHVRSIQTCCIRSVLGIVGFAFSHLVHVADAHVVGLPDTGHQMKVSLVTFGPGQEPWQRFGHNAIWVRDPLRGIDALYNYGRFSFEERRFILRFIQGRMRYWVEVQDPELTFAMYTFVNRSIHVQELALTIDQRVALRDFLEWNVKPENAFYDYDYFTDNCSTRLRDAIDRALSGAVKQQTHIVPAHTTFRFHTMRLTTHSPWLYTGLLLALGNPVDRPITVWEDMFVPVNLQEHIRTVMIPGEQGNRIPLVVREYALFESTASMPATEPPVWILWYLLGGVALAAVFLVLESVSRRNRLGRFAFAGLTGSWAFLIGCGGLLLVGLWFLTDHVDAAYNENLFFVTPLALPLALLLPLSVLRGGDALRSAMIMCHLVTGSSLIGLCIQALPMFEQVNGEVVAFVLPPNVALSIAFMRRRRLMPSREAQR